MKIKILILSFLLSGCSIAPRLLLPSAARVLEARRDAEAFTKPVESRSLEWHALKYPQFAAWGVYGYYSIQEFRKNPSIENIFIPALGIGLAWFTFENGLKEFRQ